METRNQNVIDKNCKQITNCQIGSFNDIINTLSNQIQNVIEKINSFKKENLRPKIQRDSKTQKYYTQNHFQLKLIKYGEFFQSQNKLKQIISTIKSIQQDMKNQKYSSKIQQHKIILDLIEKIKNLMKLLEKCQKNINQTKPLDGFELDSKKKCIQHLDQLSEILKECTKYLVEFEQKLRSSCCSEMEKQQQKIQNKDQKSIKSITIRNQEILRNLLNLMSKQQSPKKEYKSTTSSSSKYQIQNLSYYRDLKHYIELMLKQTHKIDQSYFNVQHKIKNFTLMLRYVMESLKIIEELQGYKSLRIMSEQQFLSHLNEIKRQIQTVKQNLEKQMTEKMVYEEVSAIVKSTAQINFYLQQTLIKYQGTQNIQKAVIQVQLRDFYNMSEKNSLIEQNVVKVLKIIQEKQKQLKKNEKPNQERIKSQSQSEEQNNKDDTIVLQTLYSEEEMEEKIKQKLAEQKKKIQNFHKTKFVNIKNEFETKIKELQDQILLKNSQIKQLTEKVNQSLNMDKKVNKKDQKDDGSWQQMSLNSKSFQDENRNNFDSMKQVIELNQKVKQLSDKIELLQAQQAELAISIDEKKSQIKKLNQQIQNSHKFISKQNQAKMEQLKDQQIKIIKDLEEQKQNNFQQKQKLAQQLEEQKVTVTELRNTVSLIEQKLLKMNASIKSGELNKLYLEMKKQNSKGNKTQLNIEQTLMQSEYKNLTNKQTLKKQVSTLKQKISQIKTQNEKKNTEIKEITSISNHLNLSLQLEKGKNQTNLKQIQQFKESVKKLTQQKMAFIMENQRFKLQIRNYSKQQHQLKQSARKIKNEAQMIEVDLKEKITNLQKLNEQNKQKMNASSEFILEQKHMIQTQGGQIEGLKAQNKLLENHVITLQKVQSQKIKLDQQVQQLNSKIEELKKQAFKVRKNQMQNIMLVNQEISQNLKRLKNLLDEKIQKQQMQKVTNKKQSNQQNQFQVINENIDHFKEQVSKSEKIIQSLKIEIQRLKNQYNHEISQKRKQIDQLKDETQKRSFETNKRFKKDREKFEQQLKQKNKQIQILQEKLQIAQTKINSLQKKLNNRS